MSLTARTLYLLQTARFFTLASGSPGGAPWAATLNYVAAYEPLRLIWYSMRAAQHSINIRQYPQISGALFRSDLQGISPLGLDGAQFTGTAREIPADECKQIHDYYYRYNFPDSVVRAEWILPLSDFFGEGARRFYALQISEWWLLDIDSWQATKEDSRIWVEIDALIPPAPA